MKSRGFTLIELVISIVVLALVIGVSMTMLSEIARASVRPDFLNRCGFLAERELERVNQLRYSMIVNQGPQNYAMPGFTDYSFRIQVAAPPAALGFGIDTVRAKQVTITVSHPAYGQVVLTTLVSNN
jgi:prepilin-type N-terminal cleavage/methylation domain-containing protein